jgi:hypothetical protein
MLRLRDLALNRLSRLLTTWRKVTDLLRPATLNE